MKLYTSNNRGKEGHPALTLAAKLRKNSTKKASPEHQALDNQQAMITLYDNYLKHSNKK